MIRTLLLAFILSWMTSLSGQTVAPTGRHFYGAPLEPETTVLHGAGQVAARNFRNYASVVGTQLSPAFFMDYAGLKDFATKESSGKTLTNTRELLREYPKLMLQLGLSMTTDGKPEEAYDAAVATGLFDVAIENLCAELNTLGCPVLIRIGYECNGAWNGYKPESYQNAFRRVATALREHKVNAALVWCAYPVDLAHAMPYYPGDEFVDWWSMDLFFPDDITNKKTAAFLETAHQHRRPVLIGECTPRTVGVTQGEASWEKWFAPFFYLIHKNPGIKGFSYINWNWAKFPQWSDWGDARLETAPELAERYREQIGHPLFQHLPLN